MLAGAAQTYDIPKIKVMTTFFVCRIALAEG